jgi:subtilisin family serine protease
MAQVSAKPPPEPVMVVIDSGLAADHPAFKGRLLTLAMVKDGLPEPLTAGEGEFWPGWDFVKRQPGTPDETGHGTHVAGLLAAALGDPEQVPARLVMFRTGHRRHELAAVTAALEATRALRVAGWDIPLVLCAFDYRQSSEDGEERERFLQAFRKLLGAGLLCVAASGATGMDLDGAEGAGQYQTELRHPALVTVAACTDDGQLLAASNYGARSVALAAPGLAVTSAAPGGGTATLSGSSQAAARVAACLARHAVASGERDPRELRSWLLARLRVHPSLPGRVESAGFLPSEADPGGDE